MRKNTCDLALSEPMLKYEKAGRFSDATHPDGDRFEQDYGSCEVLPQVAPEPVDAVETTIAVSRKHRFGNFFLQAVRVLFTCWYRAFECIFDVITNKWVWNVLLITLYVLFDVFFHLVLAASAIMVTIIINMDNVYRKTEEDDEDDMGSNVTSCTDINGMYEKETQACRKKK